MLSAFINTDSELKLALVQGAAKLPVSTESLTRVRLVLKDQNSGSIVADIDSEGQPAIPDNYFSWNVKQESVKGTTVFVLQMFLGRYDGLQAGTFDAFVIVYDDSTLSGVVALETKMRVVNLGL